MVTEPSDNLVMQYLLGKKAIILDVDHTVTEKDEGREFAFRKYGEETGDESYAHRSKGIIDRVKERAKYCGNGELKKLRAVARVELDDMLNELPKGFLTNPKLFQDIELRDGFEDFMWYNIDEGKIVVGITMATEYLANHLYENYNLPCIVCKTDDEKREAFDKLCAKYDIYPKDVICIGDGEQDMLHPDVFKVKMGDFSDFEADVYVNDFYELLPAKYVELKVTQSSL